MLRSVGTYSRPRAALVFVSDLVAQAEGSRLLGIRALTQAWGPMWAFSGGQLGPSSCFLTALASPRPKQ